MKASSNPSPEEKSAAQQIDDIIKETGGWRGEKLSELRAIIQDAGAAVVDEVKWKMPEYVERAAALDSQVEDTTDFSGNTVNLSCGVLRP